ncbi:hypothetical protein CI109_103134 [Kwoniella shandongensis]|uniref:Uncharacterized protein n=1 Tax=Kwoniella shandongensis TaxID=1734106 RepID=A0A5M6C8R7_9TREE|nr:uncharacterized protein CI109_000326 [Kwoniella shandongensis]KAA5531484.1 hypothetical protein CI109_000326 [Kwoniella shandongensis]
MPFHPGPSYSDTDGRLPSNTHRSLAADGGYGSSDGHGHGYGRERERERDGRRHGQDRIASPSSSNSSSDQFRTSGHSYTLSPEDSYNHRHLNPSHHDLNSLHRTPAQPGSSSNEYRSSGSRRGRGEDNLTVRRREANRLAAQRFRSRKKGYQDSLEERVKDLEQEKEVLLRRLDELAQIAGPSPSLQGRSSALRLSHDDYHGDKTWGPDGISNTRQEPPSNRPASPERREPPVDVDVRVAALESANRRLQDELRIVTDENERMRDELRRWQDWDRSGRTEQARRREQPDGEKFTNHFPRPNLPSLELAPLNNAAYPTSTSYTNSLASGPSGLTKIEHPESYPHHPGPSDGKSPGIHLPPLRLPPIRTAITPDGHGHGGAPLPSPSFPLRPYKPGPGSSSSVDHNR